MWPALFNFGIAHRAMVDEFVNVLGRHIGYLANAHSGFASRAKHGCFLFWHDTHKLASANPALKRLSAKLSSLPWK
jgi:hypothetical protein